MRGMAALAVVTAFVAGCSRGSQVGVAAGTVSGTKAGCPAVLARAKLGGTVLTEASLREADLNRADLRGAKLEGANLSGAVLRRPATITSPAVRPFSVGW